MSTKVLVLIEVDDDLGSDTEDFTGDLNLHDRTMIERSIGLGLEQLARHLSIARVDVEGVEGVTRESIIADVMWAGPSEGSTDHVPHG